jgi:hypothetical protein
MEDDPAPPAGNGLTDRGRILEDALVVLTRRPRRRDQELVVTFQRGVGALSDRPDVEVALWVSVTPGVAAGEEHGLRSLCNQLAGFGSRYF